MSTEDKIISFLQENFVAQNGIGDDAAILPKEKNKFYVISKDLLVEDVHFRCNYCSPQNLAHKTLAVNLSDIAAMGAKAKYVFLGISLAKKNLNYGKAFLRHFVKTCKKNNIFLLGGDTTKSTDKIVLSVTIIGVVEKNNIKKRSGAHAGDIICVAGNLGSAHIGFTALENNFPGLSKYKNIFLRPHAKQQEGIFLGKQKSVTAMMDLSDGLSTDLTRLAIASKKSAIINIDNITISKNFAAACSNLNLDPQKTILSGGEDYSLLFTVQKNNYEKLAANFKRNFGYELQCIGKITEKRKTALLYKKNGVLFYPKLNSFAHFA